MKIGSNGLNRLRRYYSMGVERTVIISESNDIYTNLALEDWYYKNWNPDNKRMLILWSNNPCVVIGKFQNPWLEANVSQLDGVKLARRNSGGGTVYHDRGNLNLSFFTPREHYNRKHNLGVITKAILKEYGLRIDITKRDDLMIGDCKVSGTAAKLARIIAYHHCTLLVNSDKEALRNSLKKPTYKIETNATQSTTSKIVNLNDINKDITVENLMVCIGKEYLTSTAESDKFHILQPTEERFPGLTEIRNSLSNWDWIFGKCPKFTAVKSYPDSSEISNNHGYKTTITFEVENGRINNVKVQFVEGLEYGLELDEFRNRKFAQELFDEVYNSVCGQLKLKQVI